MYNPVIKMHELCGTKRVRFKGPKFEIRKLQLRQICKVLRENEYAVISVVFSTVVSNVLSYENRRDTWYISKSC